MHWFPCRYCQMQLQCLCIQTSLRRLPRRWRQAARIVVSTGKLQRAMSILVDDAAPAADRRGHVLLSSISQRCIIMGGCRNVTSLRMVHKRSKVQQLFAGRFVAAARLEAGLADCPDRQLLLRALQKRRLRQYDSAVDHIMNETFLTGVPHLQPRPRRFRACNDGHDLTARALDFALW